MLGIADAVYIASVSTLGAVLIAYFGYLGVKRSGRAEKAAAATASAVDTGNDKTLGAYVHDMAQVQELTLIQTRATAGAVVELSSKVDRNTEKLERHLADVDARRQEGAREARREYVEEVRPIVQQLGEDQAREKEAHGEG